MVSGRHKVPLSRRRNRLAIGSSSTSGAGLAFGGVAEGPAGVWCISGIDGDASIDFVKVLGVVGREDEQCFCCQENKLLFLLLAAEAEGADPFESFYGRA